MLNEQARKLMATHAEIARHTESPTMAATSIDRMIGMLDYALFCGDLKPEQHSAELVLIGLLRAERFSVAA